MPLNFIYLKVDSVTAKSVNPEMNTTSTKVNAKAS